ncbi:MAG: GAF domain-containing protein [Bradymonadales bacterium]|nr:GAF domain-containing protein [Bradymonadales bacterium]
MPSPTVIERLEQQVRELTARVFKQEEKISSILEISNALRATRTEDELLNLIMEKISLLMDADRSTLYLKDERTNELWTKIKQGNRTHEVRLAMGQGIAGWVGETGQSINIQEAYADPRFNPEVDRRTGYVTKSILCQPMRDQDRRIVGVIQVLNKKHGPFTADEELLLSAIAAQAAIVIENGALYHSMLEANWELNEIREALEQKIAEQNMLFEIQSSIAQAVSIDALVESVAQKTLELIPSQACAITLRENGGRILYLYQAEHQEPHQPPSMVVSRRVDDAGPSALVTSQGVPYLCNNEAPCSVNSAIYQQGVRYQTVLAVPLFSDDLAFGSIELINKKQAGNNGGTAKYTDTDLKLLTLLAGQIAPATAAFLFRVRKEKDDRLAVIGQMLSSVLHDFKNPITIISGYVQLMERTADPELRKEYAGSIQRQFELLNQMSQEVLAFARGERSIFLTKVYLNRFMEEIEQLLTQEFEGRNITLQVHTGYRRQAKFDEGKMKRAIFNLARNAREAMPDGGRFDIEVDRDGDQLVFVVSDSGTGIPEDVRDRMFESFVTHGKQGGTGLGLAMVKKMVEEHNGTISFESEAGRGTTFEIRLPLLT